MIDPEEQRAERIVDTRIINVRLTLGTALLLLCTVAAAWLIVQLLPIFLVTIVALMLVGMINPAIDLLEHRRMKRGWAIVVVFAAYSIGGGLFLGLTVPQFVAQVSEIIARLPRIQNQVVSVLHEYRTTAALGDALKSQRSSAIVNKVGQLILSNSSKIIETVAYSLTSLFLALYIILDRDRIRGALFAVVPRDYHMRLSRVLLNFETIVGGYLRGQLLTSALMAAFAFVVLSLAHVPSALALSVFAGLVDILPYVGAFLVVIPAFLVSLSQGTVTAFIVLGSLMAYEEFESRFIVPKIYGHVLRLPAAGVMMALLVGGKLMGILGALLALPIAAGIRMVIEEMRISLPGEGVHDGKTLADDARSERVFAERSAGVPAAEAAAIAVEIAQTRIHDAGLAASEKAELPRPEARIITGPR